MSELLKQSGLIIIFIGIILLIVTMASGTVTNKILLWSLIIVLLGLIEYILVNRFVED
jgi:predicted membrane protein